jgi:orotate phosphoribosyltransferase-like protein
MTEPVRDARRIPDYARAKIAKKARLLYESGLTLRQVAVKVKVSPNTLRVLIVEAGGQLRSPGRRHEPHLTWRLEPGPGRDATAAEVFRLRSNGMRYSDIREQLSIRSDSTIRMLYREHTYTVQRSDLSKVARHRRAAMRVARETGIPYSVVIRLREQLQQQKGVS